ncbi:monovalent cation/H+ antiporter subunit D [Thiomicrorhabdus indica]|uniref:monovalent cation/H+ antiporter subunit D n=1 Tax=Thiomicrorhabdus indica TaxID=2267253 RepID=UPI002AA8B868|nr:monovalent cation/H+ antiporter subunit D [Thiomicrorhabdus indica]
MQYLIEIVSPHLPILPLLLPLVAGMVVLLVANKGITWQRTISLVATLGLFVMAIANFTFSLEGSIQIYALGNWQAPFGIVMVLDQLSALMLVLVALLAVTALWFAIRQNIDSQGAHFHPLFQVQLFGLNGAFLTGDLFNLFVFFEVLLLASYGLLLHGGGRHKTKAGLHYVVLNLIGSTLFLFAVGTLYGILGTLNIADMGQRITQLATEDLGVVAVAGLMLLLVFGLKAAMFPLYLWLPHAYSHTTAPVAALFAIMTKVGLYAIIRVHGTLFGEQAGELAGIHTPWVLGLGLITLIMAAMGALAAKFLRQQIAYLVLASVATLLIASALPGVESLAALLFYLIHSTFIAAGFFLLAYFILQGRGQKTDQLVRAYSMPNAILIGSFFVFAALAISGLPPLSGFFGKLLILSSALEHPLFFGILAVVLISGLLMIIALAKSGSQIFYHILKKEADHSIRHCNTHDGTCQLSLAGIGSVVILFSISVWLVVFAHPTHKTLNSVAQQTLDRTQYQQQVLNFTPIANSRKELVE